jgi:hypothetical protein
MDLANRAGSLAVFLVPGMRNDEEDAEREQSQDGARSNDPSPFRTDSPAHPTLWVS